MDRPFDKRTNFLYSISNPISTNEETHMTLKHNRTLPLHLLFSFLTAWALMKASRMEPGNILTFVFFLLAFFFYQHVERRKGLLDISNRTALAAAVCFTLLYMLVDYPHYIELLTSPLYRFIILSVIFSGFVCLFYHLLLFLFSYVCDKELLRKALLTPYQGVPFLYAGRRPGLSACVTATVNFGRNHTALLTFFCCLFCWLPYYLYEYPGIMTPDSVNQFEQVLGRIPWSNHHPWAHTLTFGLFYRIGHALTGDMTAAVACYTFSQMCLLAGSAACLISTLRACRIRPFVLLLLTAFYALIPYHAVFSVTIWKDIPFAAASLLLGCAILRLAVLGSVCPKNVALFAIASVMICLFRSNGWYGYLLSLPFLLFAFRKLAKAVYPALLAAFLCAVIVKYPLMRAFQVEQPDFVESISIPLQQIAAVICNDRELAPADLALIEQVADLTYIHELYNPTFADNIKELVRAGNQDYLIAHKKEFLRLWARLFARYPGDFLHAYIQQTYGYWYPDSFYLVAEAEGISAGNLGLSPRHLIGGPLVVKGKEIAIKLGGMVPLYGCLWSMGAACWVLLFSVCAVIIRREREKLICYLPSAALFLTVLVATPVATEFRYVYFLVFCLPFYLMVAMLPEEAR